MRQIWKINRVSVVSIILCLLLTLSPNVSTQNIPSSTYQDGAYVATSDATDRGYVLAVVFIENGDITRVRLGETDGAGHPKSHVYPWEPYHEAIRELPLAFVEANGAQIDAVTGATGTSVNAMQAVERALRKAQGSLTSTYFDGTFFGRSPADDHGFGIALVTIEHDRIVAVTLGEFNADGTEKIYEQYPHETTVEGRLILQHRLVEKGDADVDGITGATGSSKKWLAAVEYALKTARTDQ